MDKPVKVEVPAKADIEPLVAAQGEEKSFVDQVSRERQPLRREAQPTRSNREVQPRPGHREVQPRPGHREVQPRPGHREVQPNRREVNPSIGR